MDRSADRNLLLGILALQNDLVARDQLIQGMQAWTANKDRPLGEILVELGALDQEHHRLLEHLLDVHVQRHGSVHRSMEACEPTSSVRAAFRDVADADAQATLSALHQRPDPDVTTESSSAVKAGIGSGSGASDEIRYRVLRPHAKGGLGEVFVAEDLELHREVALKEIQRQHADQKASRNRFVLEAEVTGGLEHPGIVPVYGLGTHADGRPFYAMRFIKGDNLKHASNRFHQTGARFDGLEFRQLLGRFIDVCNAVAYAHSRGVLHRDLKPGNIMLGKFGETLVVDWGLAKVVDRGETADGDEPALMPASGSGVAETLQGTAIGTPAFMSPEQASGSVTDLGPATDVYSLGATLYALLTNRPPIEDDNLVTALRKVRCGEIPRPRDVNVAIPKPLEAICLKAVALQPDQRHATPIALARDLEQWMADEPVSCYHEPFSVRVGRWVKRHRTLVTSCAISALLLLSCVSGGLVLLAQHNRELEAEKSKTDAANVQLVAEKQKVEDANRLLAQTNRELETANEQQQAARRQTETVLEFFQDKVLAAARPEEQEGGLGIHATVREAIDAAEPLIAESFHDEPLVEASIRAVLGSTYDILGEPQMAVRQNLRTCEILEAEVGPQDALTLRSKANLAIAYKGAGELAKALALYESVLPLLENELGPTHSSTLQITHNLAVAYWAAGKLDTALALLDRVLTAQTGALGQEHPTTLATLSSIAAVHFAAGRAEKALEIDEEVLRLAKKAYGPEHPETLRCMSNLALAYNDTGDFDRAAPLYEEVLRLRMVKLGREHPHTLIAMNNLGKAYHDARRLDEALPLLEEAVLIKTTKLGRAHPSTLTSMNNLMVAYRDAKQLEKAVLLAEETVQGFRTALGPQHPSTLAAMNNLAMMHWQQGALEQSVPMFEEILRLRKAISGAEHPATLQAAANLGVNYRDAGRLAEAIPLLEQAHQAAGRHAMLRWVGPQLIDVYIKAGKRAEASAMAIAQLQTVRSRLKEGSPELGQALASGGKLLLDVQAFAEAEPFVRECLRIREQTQPDEWTTFNTMSMLGAVLAGEGSAIQSADAAAATAKFAEAEPLLIQGYDGMQQRADKMPPQAKTRLTEALQRLVDLYTAWGKPEEAARWQQKLNEAQATEAVP